MVDRHGLHSNRIYRVKNTGNPDVFRLFSVCRVGIPVVIIHAEPEDAGITALIPFCQGRIFKNPLQRIDAALDGKLRRLIQWIDGNFSVAGAYQVNGIAVDHPLGGKNLPGKKVVKRTIRPFDIRPHIHLILFNKGADQKAGSFPVKKNPSCS